MCSYTKYLVWRTAGHCNSILESIHWHMNLDIKFSSTTWNRSTLLLTDMDSSSPSWKLHKNPEKLFLSFDLTRPNSTAVLGLFLKKEMYYTNVLGITYYTINGLPYLIAHHSKYFVTLHVTFTWLCYS